MAPPPPAIKTKATTPDPSPGPFAAWPGWMQPGGFTPGDPGSSQDLPSATTQTAGS
jgi:hypothetical protein